MVVNKKLLPTFELVFSSDRAYTAGDKVAGRVRLQTAQPLRVTAVRVVALGYARAQLVKGSQPLRQQQEYLRYEETLLPDGENRTAGEGEVRGQLPVRDCGGLGGQLPVRDWGGL
ncbi:hypothetical protein chiPu_0028561, partial [Chiloscyllium punctatum]|nr:hypothetical protein [Chiloscyllium punctatum]